MTREVWQLQRTASLQSCALRVPTPELICLKDGMQFQRKKCECLLLHALCPANPQKSGFSINCSCVWMPTSASRINWCQITPRTLALERDGRTWFGGSRMRNTCSVGLTTLMCVPLLVSCTSKADAPHRSVLVLVFRRWLKR